MQRLIFTFSDIRMQIGGFGAAFMVIWIFLAGFERIGHSTAAEGVQVHLDPNFDTRIHNMRRTNNQCPSSYVRVKLHFELNGEKIKEAIDGILMTPWDDVQKSHDRAEVERHLGFIPYYMGILSQAVIF